jgi:protein SCO1
MPKVDFVSGKARRPPGRGRFGVNAAIWGMLSMMMMSMAAPVAAGVDAKVHSAPKLVAPFTLQKANGQSFSQEDLKGRWSLVVLGFTHCPDVCPFTLQNLAQVQEELSLRVSPDKRPQVVFIGVDPDRDRKVIGKYVRFFNDEFIGATGEWEEISKVVDSLGGFVRISGKDKDPEDYEVFHSATIAIVDPQGRLAAGINPPMPPAETAAFLSNLMSEKARKSAARQ